MKVLIPTDELNLQYYNNWIKDININQNFINLIGDNIQEFIFNKEYFFSITTSNLNLNLNNLLVKELYIINNFDKSKSFWNNYIKEKKYVLLFQSDDIIICTGKNIYKIVIYLKDKVSSSLLSYNRILTNEGIKNYKWNKDFCFESFEETINNCGLFWTNIQQQIYDNISNFFQVVGIIKQINFDFDIKELYNFYCLNIQNSLSFFNYEYFLNTDNLNLGLYFCTEFNFNFFNKITNIIKNDNYFPTYAIQKNWCVENGYNFITLKDNIKILTIFLDKHNDKNIQLLFPKQFFGKIEILNLDYKDYNKNYYIITTNNPTNIFIILKAIEYIIYAAIYKGYEIEPDEGLINVQNN